MRGGNKESGFGYNPRGGGYENLTQVEGGYADQRPRAAGVKDLPWKDIFSDAPQVDFQAVKAELEGPTPLRVLAGLGGLAMAVASGLGLVNLSMFFSKPCQYIIQAYEAAFGIAVMLIELKTMSSANDAYGVNKSFLYKWFPFSSIVGGKGATYIFFGTLGISFGMVNPLLFVPGLFMIVMGGIYLLIHFAKCRSMEEKYAKSVYYSQYQGR